jgi:hypothetical protein
LDILEERPHGYRERVAVLRNDKLKETIIIQYGYSTRILSATASCDPIKGSGPTYNPEERDVYNYHDVDVEMFDKLVNDFTGRYGFTVLHEGKQLY